MMMNYPMGLFLFDVVCPIDVVRVPFFAKLLMFSSDIRSGSSIGSTTDFDSSSSRPETRTMKLKSSEILRSSSSSFLSRKFRSKKPLFHSKTEDLSNKDDLHLDEKIRATTVTKIRHSDDDIRPISTSEDET